jgi:CO dehydrogenase/acetyl-CoA synthase beta subunit
LRHGNDWKRLDVKFWRVMTPLSLCKTLMQKEEEEEEEEEEEKEENEEEMVFHLLDRISLSS